MDKKEKKYYEAVSSIILSGNFISDQVSQVLKPYNMTEPQYNVLRILEDSVTDYLTVQEIQQGMLKKSSNVTRIIDRLVEKDFVTREVCDTNRRKMLIKMTKNGAKALVEYNHEVRRFHKPHRENLTEEECQLLVDLLKKFNGGL